MITERLVQGALFPLVAVPLVLFVVTCCAGQGKPLFSEAGSSRVYGKSGYRIMDCRLFPGAGQLAGPFDCYNCRGGAEETPRCGICEGKGKLYHRED